MQSLHCSPSLLQTPLFSEFSPDEQIILTGTSVEKDSTTGGLLCFYDRTKLEIVQKVGISPTGSVVQCAWHPRLNQQGGMIKETWMEEDPREAIFKYADVAVKDPMFIAPAYSQTQLKTIFTEEDKDNVKK